MLDRRLPHRLLLTLPGVTLSALLAVTGCSSSDSGGLSGAPTSDAGQDSPSADGGQDGSDTDGDTDAAHAEAGADGANTDGDTDAAHAEAGADGANTDGDTDAANTDADTDAQPQPDGAPEAEASTPPTCTELTAGAFAIGNYSAEAADFTASTTPDLDTAASDVLSLQFFAPASDPSINGGATGTFDLSAGADANYQTCARCLLLAVDPTVPGRTFFQQSGSIDIDPSSDQLNGKLKATLTDVTLIEVTIAQGTFESTPVPGGACVHLASATIDVAPIPPPAAWVCDPKFYADGACDCGCGAFDDHDCADATVASCAYCDDPGSCNTGDCPGTIDATDNSICTP